MDKSSTSSRSPENVEGEPVAKKSKLVLKTIIYDESIPNQWLDEPPLEVWDHHIIPLLSLKDLALARPVCTFFEAYWQDKFSNNVLPLRVGNDVATIDDVMGVIEILSSRRVYTKLNPFIVLLGKGEHQITSSWGHSTGYVNPTTIRVTCSNILFVGKGKDITTVLGGFYIDNLENITFKNMTVTNTSARGDGVCMSDANVELMDVAFKRCNNYGLSTFTTDTSSSKTTVVATRCEFANSINGAVIHGSLASATFNNCVFHDNELDGIQAEEKATIHLHGEATAIHSNRDGGIYAVDGGKVLIHLPSHHNTCYNNEGNDRYTANDFTNAEDRLPYTGSTITNVED